VDARLSTGTGRAGREGRSPVASLDRVADAVPGAGERCKGMVKDPGLVETDGTQRSLSEALGQLIWVYLQLLVTRQATCGCRGRRWDPAHVEPLNTRRRTWSVAQIRATGCGSAAKSRGSARSAHQRLASQQEAGVKIDFTMPSWHGLRTRSLVREQAVLAAIRMRLAPDRCDQSTLGSTTQWIRARRIVGRTGGRLRVRFPGAETGRTLSRRLGGPEACQRGNIPSRPAATQSPY